MTLKSLHVIFASLLDDTNTYSFTASKMETVQNKAC